MSTHPANDKRTLYFDESAKTSVSTDNVYLEASEQFANTTYTQELSERTLIYLKIGYPVHLTGPAGIGKTTMALHIAAQLGNPVILVHGNDEFTSSDLIGKGSGYHRSHVIDNFVHSVVKTEEEITTLWIDNHLTLACEQGYTLVYDEFNRSRAEANNVLLSVLSEGILSLQGRRQKDKAGYMEVHANFRAIFTSNSEEYVGIHKTQNALTDRLITILVNYPDRESEIQIVQKRSGISRQDAETIVNIARAIRQAKIHNPSIRACIAIARVLAYLQRSAEITAPWFQTICRDIFGIESNMLAQLINSLNTLM